MGIAEADVPLAGTSRSFSTPPGLSIPPGRLTAILGNARLLGADAQGLALLGRAMAPLERSAWPHVAWRFSRLTADGCPVELGVSTHRGAFRVTLECAPPECPEPTRLDAALALLRALDMPLPAPEHVAAWRARQAGRAPQAGSALRWGCWLGLRFGRGAVGAKLYVELPRESPNAPRMLGHDVRRMADELYATLPDPSEATLRHAMRGLGASVQDAMLTALEATLGLPLSRALAWAAIGVSREPAEPRRTALFCRARAVRGGIAALQGRFVHVPGYTALIAGRARPDHGVLSFVPRPDGTIELRAGLSAC
jgi:hypothetical protein